jgi:hypothetical protein
MQALVRPKGPIMTRQRDFKSLVRERMAKTGERYTTARTHLLARTIRHSQPAKAFPGVLSGYDTFGGQQPGTGAIHNVLRFLGIASALGAPPSEAMVNGLCGGPGFLYAVFEYKGWPPMLTLALGNRSMPDVYAAQGLSRLGVRLVQHETTSRTAAQKMLDQTLDAGTPALCVTDAASLPHYGLPKHFVGGAPHVVAVAGRDGDGYWIDDRQAEPLRVTGTQLADARAAYRKARNRLVAIEKPQKTPSAAETHAMIAEAIADTALRYVEPAVPKSFAVNCGFSGLAKWRDELTDRKGKRGWPSMFAEGARAYAALHRAYEDIECRSTAGGRAFYADFLEEVAGLLGQDRLRRAAAEYREAATLWSRVADTIASCPDEAVRQACDIADRRVELNDAVDKATCAEAAGLWQQRQKLAERCKLGRDAAVTLYEEMASQVDGIFRTETRAVELLKR